jgi:hypothetical protein
MHWRGSWISIANRFFVSEALTRFLIGEGPVAARENQGAPNDLEERQKLERVLHDELAQLRDKQCEERQPPGEPQPHASARSWLPTEMSMV